MAFLFGLAPSGVYPATPVTRSAVRSYRTISPLPTQRTNREPAVSFLLHWPWTHVPQTLSGTLPCGARTFLQPPERPAIIQLTCCGMLVESLSRGNRALRPKRANLSALERQEITYNLFPASKFELPYYHWFQIFRYFVMVRLLILAVSSGILVALLVYLAAPLLVSEADIVAFAARALLDASNALFTYMPQFIADFIAGLNLLIVSITSGLLAFVGILILVKLVSSIKATVKLAKHWFAGRAPTEEPEDLAPIDMEERYKKPPKGKEIMGRSLDSMRRD